MNWGWEVFWFMVVLKIPIVYLGVVVWWAIRAKPLPLEPAVVASTETPYDPRPRRRLLRHAPRPRRRGPHGSPRDLRGRPRVARSPVTAEKR